MSALSIQGIVGADQPIVQPTVIIVPAGEMKMMVMEKPCEQYVQRDLCKYL